MIIIKKITPYDLYYCDFGGEFVERLVSDEDAIPCD